MVDVRLLELSIREQGKNVLTGSYQIKTKGLNSINMFNSGSSDKNVQLTWHNRGRRNAYTCDIEWRDDGAH